VDFADTSGTNHTKAETTFICHTVFTPQSSTV